MQIFGRKTIRRFEQRASYGSITVSYVQNLHVNSGTWWLSESEGQKIRKHQNCKPCCASNSHRHPHLRPPDRRGHCWFLDGWLIHDLPCTSTLYGRNGIIPTSTPIKLRSGLCKLTIFILLNCNFNFYAMFLTLIVTLSIILIYKNNWFKKHFQDSHFQPNKKVIFTQKVIYDSFLRFP